MHSFNALTFRARLEEVSSLEALESRRLLSSMSPKVTALESAAKAGVAGIEMAQYFQPVQKLIAPDASAKSYLNLSAFTPFDVDFDALAASLSAAPTRAQVIAGEADLLTIAIPTPDGTFERFGIVKSEAMEPALAAQHPELATFAGQGIDDPAATIALDHTPQGFHASVLGSNGRYYIDPYFHLNPDAGEVAYYTDNNLGDGIIKCLMEDEPAFTEESEPLPEPSLVDGTSLLGGTLRTYRLAIGSTAEYTAFHGGASGALSAITTTVVRLNQVYERDFAIHMNLVANESAIIYTNASTDPYGTPNDAAIANADNQTALDNVIGSANYDIGHVYYRSGSSNDNNGLAGGIGTVGNASNKAEGYTAYTSPVGDNFVIDYVVHEMGHQFGGRHNFNSVGGGPRDSYSLGVEPGSGQSIMGYAGLGTPQENILSHSLPQFNANNYVVNTTNAAAQILQYTLTSTSSKGYTSAVKSASGNSPPTVSVDGSAFSIPVSTPFALTATASDANGDALTYSWEQLDGSLGTSGNTAVALSTVGGIASVPSATTTNGPAFRVFGASTNPTRTFPVLSAVLANRTYDNGERLPSVARTMRFAVVARDNHSGGGGVAIGRLTITTVAGAVFSLTSFNSSTSVNGGSSQVINWTNTNTAAGSTINAANVNILLSTDGGQTFPTTLASNVTNDGSETVTMPYNVGTTSARIKIVPTDNVFFDINNANFTINLIANTSATPSAPVLVTTSDTGVSDSDNVTRLNNADASSVLEFSISNTVAGSLVELLTDGVVIGSKMATGSTTTISTNGDVTNGTQALTDGPHNFSARQTETGKVLSSLAVSQLVTIDATSPVLDSKSYAFETAPINVSFSFDEPLFLSGAGSASVVNVDTSVAAGTVMNTAGSIATITIAGILDDGNYRALLELGTLTDLAGNSPATDATLDFSFLNADATHDLFVDTQDFNLLAANFGGSSKNFSQGNFDYDLAGNVDSVDFNLLVTQYGKRLAAPAAGVGMAGALFADSGEFSPDRLEI